MDTEFEGNIYTSFSLQVIQKLASFVLGPDSARALRLSSSCSATGIQKTHWCLKHLWQREMKYWALDRPLYVNRSADFQDFEAKTMPPSADNYSLLRKQLLAWHWAPGETEPLVDHSTWASHYDLGVVWLIKPKTGACTATFHYQMEVLYIRKGLSRSWRHKLHIQGTEVPLAHNTPGTLLILYIYSKSTPLASWGT